MIITDAHQFLLDNFMDYDFIWSSPPCPTHSRARFWGDHIPKFPDMKLYEEILLLQHYCKVPYCIENVVSYYEPLIKPQKISRHYFWSNFYITGFNEPDYDFNSVTDLQRHKGFDLSKYTGFRKDAVLRSCIYPPLGKHILDCARNKTQQTLSMIVDTKQ